MALFRILKLASKIVFTNSPKDSQYEIDGKLRYMKDGKSQSTLLVPPPEWEIHAAADDHHC